MLSAITWPRTESAQRSTIHCLCIFNPVFNTSHTEQAIFQSAKHCRGRHWRCLFILNCLSRTSPTLRASCTRFVREVESTEAQTRARLGGLAEPRRYEALDLSFKCPEVPQHLLRKSIQRILPCFQDRDVRVLRLCAGGIRVRVVRIFVSRNWNPGKGHFTSTD